MGWSRKTDSDAQGREDSPRCHLKASGEHRHYSNYVYWLAIRELKGFPINAKLSILKSRDQIRFFARASYGKR